MIKNIRKEKGVTMITVTIAVIILLVITGILVYNAKDVIYIRNYNALKNDIELKPSTKLISHIVFLKEVEKGTAIGYSRKYIAPDRRKIATIPLGYADGIIRKNTGRHVYIKGRKYKIVGNICMDMLFVEVDENVNLYDKVEVLKDNKHIEETAKYLETIPYEILCEIGVRVPRIYKN